MDAATADWLTTDEAASLLIEHATVEASPAVVALLRKTLSAERAAAVLEQVELRRRAAAKFKAPGRLLLTRKGLEQATDEWIAAYKARRFAATAGEVIDVCCGIGGDLMGLRSGGVAVTGVDTDPASARFAEWNSGAAVRCVDAASLDWRGYAAWHGDPDRRAAGRRTTQPESHEPSLETLAGWRDRCADAAIKLAPAARLPESWTDASETEWISRRGECKQLVVWCGRLAQAVGGRCATRVFDDGRPPASLAGEPGVAVPVADAIGAYVFDPDAAVLAADLVGASALGYGLAAFAPPVAYLTGDRPIDDPMLVAFTVEEVMPLVTKRLAEWLAERRVGRLEIKVRGVRVDPARLRKELRPKGDAERTLIVAPGASGRRGRPLVVVARRVGANAAGRSV